MSVVHVEWEECRFWVGVGVWCGVMRVAANPTCVVRLRLVRLRRGGGLVRRGGLVRHGGRGRLVRARREHAARRHEPQRRAVAPAHHQRPGVVVRDDVLALAVHLLLRLLRRQRAARLLRLLLRRLRHQAGVHAPRSRHAIVRWHARDQRAHIRRALLTRVYHVRPRGERLLRGQLLLQLKLLLLLLLQQLQLRCRRLPARRRCLLRPEQLLQQYKTSHEHFYRVTEQNTRNFANLFHIELRVAYKNYNLVFLYTRT